MKIVILILSLAFLASCNKEKQEQEKRQKRDSTVIVGTQPKASLEDMSKLNFIDEKLEQDLKKALIESDTLTYKRCYKKYVISGFDKEFLYYAVIMAEKNNFKGAYDDISRILSIQIDNSKHDFSSKFGNYSLLKAYEMGDKSALEGVLNIYVKKNKSVPLSKSIYCGQ